MLARSNGKQIGLTDGGIFCFYKSFRSFPLGVVKIEQETSILSYSFCMICSAIAWQFHIALSVNRFPLCRSGGLDGAFLIGHLCAALAGCRAMKTIVSLSFRQTVPAMQRNMARAQVSNRG